VWWDVGGMIDPARACTRCPSRLLLGGTNERPFWVCPECHMAFLSPALMGHADPDAARAAQPLRNGATSS
jgi:hypothetical protein